MSAADLHRFAVACAVLSDLYCPCYDPRQPLAKESNLARTAVRYKVDTSQTKSTSNEKPGNTPPQNSKRLTQKKKK
jgi:hypothetical protein